jgi:hypothetical protein
MAARPLNETRVMRCPLLSLLQPRRALPPCSVERDARSSASAVPVPVPASSSSRANSAVERRLGGLVAATRPCGLRTSFPSPAPQLFWNARVRSHWAAQL